MQNGLQLNPDKSEALSMGTATQLRAVSSLKSVSVADVDLPVADSMRVLGVTLDRRLTFDNHAAAVARSCNWWSHLWPLYAYASMCSRKFNLLFPYYLIHSVGTDQIPRQPAMHCNSKRAVYSSAQNWSCCCFSTRTSAYCVSKWQAFVLCSR